jgi:hypothetical protein
MQREGGRYLKKRNFILSDNSHHSLFKAFRMAAASADLTAISFCRETGSTHSIQFIEVKADFYLPYLKKALEIFSFGSKTLCSMLEIREPTGSEY